MKKSLATRVSVLVLTYGHEETLKQAVDSILGQVLPENTVLEVVIALDRSPDATAAIAEVCRSSDPERVRIVTGPTNLGMMGNLRRGFAACVGDFIGICEGDDFWTSPRKIARQLEGLAAAPDLFVSATMGEKLFPNGHKEKAWKLRRGDGRVASGKVLARGGIAVPTASLLWRADALRGLPEWVFKAPVGDVFLLLAGLRNRGIWYVDSPCVVYRVDHSGSWSEKFNQWTNVQRDHYAEQMIECYLKATNSFTLYAPDLVPRISSFRRLRCDLAIERGDWRFACQQARHLPLRTILRTIAGRVLRLLGISQWKRTK